MAYYQFNKDHMSREEQLEALKQLRAQTREARDKQAQLKQKRKATLKARLKKVKQRKLIREGKDPALAGPGGGKDPALAEDDSGGFTRQEGAAFRTDAEGNTIPPSYTDVDQGSLGDCWLMAASAAVAHRDPERLQNRISQNEDGSFNVQLGDETRVVQPTFPDAGYADPTPNNQSDTLWPALIEKAYANREGNSYENLDGGNAGRALEALTGEPTTRTSINSSSDLDSLYGTLRGGIDGDHPMVAATRDEGVADPFHDNHAYAVLDAYERDGQRYVKVYNPWGTNDGARTADAMTHEMTQLADAFGWDLDDFQWLTVNAMKSAFAPFPERLRLINGVIKPRYAVLKSEAELGA